MFCKVDKLTLGVFFVFFSIPPVYLSRSVSLCICFHTLHKTNTKVWLGMTSSCQLLQSLQTVHLLD